MESLISCVKISFSFSARSFLNKNIIKENEINNQNVFEKESEKIKSCLVSLVNTTKIMNELNEKREIAYFVDKCHRLLRLGNKKNKIIQKAETNENSYSCIIYGTMLEVADFLWRFQELYLCITENEDCNSSLSSPASSFNYSSFEGANNLYVTFDFQELIKNESDFFNQSYENQIELDTGESSMQLLVSLLMEVYGYDYIENVLNFNLSIPKAFFLHFRLLNIVEVCKFFKKQKKWKNIISSKTQKNTVENSEINEFKYMLSVSFGGIAKYVCLEENGEEKGNLDRRFAHENTLGNLEDCRDSFDFSLNSFYFTLVFVEDWDEVLYFLNTLQPLAVITESAAYNSIEQDSAQQKRKYECELDLRPLCLKISQIKRKKKEKKMDDALESKISAEIICDLNALDDEESTNKLRNVSILSDNCLHTEHTDNGESDRFFPCAIPELHFNVAAVCFNPLRKGCVMNESNISSAENKEIFHSVRTSCSGAVGLSTVKSVPSSVQSPLLSFCTAVKSLESYETSSNNSCFSFSRTVKTGKEQKKCNEEEMQKEKVNKRKKKCAGVTVKKENSDEKFSEEKSDVTFHKDGNETEENKESNFHKHNGDLCTKTDNLHDSFHSNSQQKKNKNFINNLCSPQFFNNDHADRGDFIVDQQQISKNNYSHLPCKNSNIFASRKKNFVHFNISNDAESHLLKKNKKHYYNSIKDQHDNPLPKDIAERPHGNVKLESYYKQKISLQNIGEERKRKSKKKNRRKKSIGIEEEAEKSEEEAEKSEEEKKKSEEEEENSKEEADNSEKEDLINNFGGIMDGSYLNYENLKNNKIKKSWKFSIECVELTLFKNISNVYIKYMFSSLHGRKQFNTYPAIHIQRNIPLNPIPNGFCFYEFCCSFSSMKTLFKNNILIFQIYQKDKYKLDELVGEACLNTSLLLKQAWKERKSFLFKSLYYVLDIKTVDKNLFSNKSDTYANNSLGELHICLFLEDFGIVEQIKEERFLSSTTHLSNEFLLKKVQTSNDLQNKKANSLHCVRSYSVENTSYENDYSSMSSCKSAKIKNAIANKNDKYYDKNKVNFSSLQNSRDISIAWLRDMYENKLNQELNKKEKKLLSELEKEKNNFELNRLKEFEEKHSELQTLEKQLKKKLEDFQQKFFALQQKEACVDLDVKRWSEDFASTCRRIKQENDTFKLLQKEKYKDLMERKKLVDEELLLQKFRIEELEDENRNLKMQLNDSSFLHLKSELKIKEYQMDDLTSKLSAMTSSRNHFLSYCTLLMERINQIKQEMTNTSGSQDELSKRIDQIRLNFKKLQKVMMIQNNQINNSNLNDNDNARNLKFSSYATNRESRMSWKSNINGKNNDDNIKEEEISKIKAKSDKISYSLALEGKENNENLKDKCNFNNRYKTNENVNMRMKVCNNSEKLCSSVVQGNKNIDGVNNNNSCTTNAVNFCNETPKTAQRDFLCDSVYNKQKIIDDINTTLLHNIKLYTDFDKSSQMKSEKQLKQEKLKKEMKRLLTSGVYTKNDKIIQTLQTKINELEK